MTNPPPGAVAALLAKGRSALPKGGKLPSGAWGGRHQLVVNVLWAHSIAIPIYALLMGMSLSHSLLEGAPIAVMAWIASRGALNHRIRMGVATFALVSCSAILVHVSGGLIEMHFHFFVVVGIVTLYQSWMPFLLAIAYVVVHHGVMGSLLPEEIYNHMDAVAHPWKWAAIHGGFILAMSAAGLLAWKFAEDAQQRAVESERKHFDEERRRLMEREEAAEQLQERDQQLRQAQKMEAVGHLAGGIAHDFNNLLSVVVNYARFLVEDISEKDPRRQDAIEIIKAGDRGAKLIRQLLTFSRKEVTRPTVVNITEVVSDTFSILSRTINENIQLTTDLGDDAWNIEVDRGHVEQLLMNLVVNARDAIGTDAGRITIITRNAEIPPDVAVVNGVPQGHWVSLSVVDTGQGMSEETKAHVFEPFFTTKGVGSGTGLGMATVYGIVQQAGGHIGIESAPGQGTTVTMYFPRTAEAITHGESGTYEANSAAPVMRARILVVEDEEAALKVAVRILSRAGYDVVAHESSVNALEQASIPGHGIDLLLTDVIMPEMSGRALSEALGLPTVFMSGYAGAVLGSHDASDTPLLQKPFSGSELVAAVESVLDRTAHSPL